MNFLVSAYDLVLDLRLELMVRQCWNWSASQTRFLLYHGRLKSHILSDECQTKHTTA